MKGPSIDGISVPFLHFTNCAWYKNTQCTGLSVCCCLNYLSRGWGLQTWHKKQYIVTFSCRVPLFRWSLCSKWIKNENISWISVKPCSTTMGKRRQFAKSWIMQIGNKQSRSEGCSNKDTVLKCTASWTLRTKKPEATFLYSSSSLPKADTVFIWATTVDGVFWTPREYKNSSLSLMQLSEM